MLGDQNVSPLYMPWSPWRRNSWCLARASSEIATATSCSRVGVPHRRQADRLREHRGDAGARDAVQALVPPVVGGDAQPLDRRRLVQHLRRLLGERHAPDQIVDARLERQVGVLERKLGTRMSSPSRPPATSCAPCRRACGDRQVRGVVRILRRQRLVDVDAEAGRLARVQRAVRERVGVREDRVGLVGVPHVLLDAEVVDRRGRSAAPPPCRPATGRSRRGSRCARGTARRGARCVRRWVMPPACTTVVRM